MPDEQRPWYTITYSAGLQPLKQTFRERELTSALLTYGYVRRDLPGGHRIDLRWAEEGLQPHGQPYDGQIWRNGQRVAQEGGTSASVLLRQLRAKSATLEPPPGW